MVACYHEKGLFDVNNTDLEKLLDKEEITGLKLCSMYKNAGFEQFRMGKFEEYDLYAGNKEFLVSEDIITFTDTNGSLMALKPDVTLSIVKNTRQGAGSLSKYYYNENVYRKSGPSGSFKEIRQVGLEALGDVDENCILEVLKLAADSLREIAGDGIIKIADRDILEDAVKVLNIPSSVFLPIYKCIGEKNLHELKAVLENAGADSGLSEKLIQIAAASGEGDEVLKSLEGTGIGGLEKLKKLFADLRSAGIYEMFSLDFSVVNDFAYYNGIVFKGFIGGVPQGILSGGQYDRLPAKMGRRGGAIGFAVYLDMLERYDAEEFEAGREYLNIALPKGRLGEKVYKMLAASGMDFQGIMEDNRRLVFVNDDQKLRLFWVKPSDVTVYVERGVADVGIAGKDILLEYEPDVYELLDLKLGKCRMAVAGKKDFSDDRSKTLRVATKFSSIAKKYYSALGRDIDIIHLNGSIEIAPILGLSDVIVDIVETGTTLRENDLEVKDEIVPISARLIANKSSYEFKRDMVERIYADIAAALSS